MYSSILSILAVGSLYLTSSSATPTGSSIIPSSKLGIAATVNHLDSKGMIHWTATVNGGRAAIIAEELVSYARHQLGPNNDNNDKNNNKTLQARDVPKAKVGEFTDFGKIAGYNAAYACGKSGAYGVSSTIDWDAQKACESLVSQVPDVPIAENAWRVWQSAIAPGAEGEPVTTMYRYFSNTAAAPQLTWSICSLAFEELTHTFCQGKGLMNAATRGGEIRIGSKDDYLMIGFDPNVV